MDVKNIQNGVNSHYDSFLVDSLNIGKTKHIKKKEIIQEPKRSDVDKIKWQQNVLLSALDDLENNIQVDNSSPLFDEANAPIESYKEALAELRKVVQSNNKEFFEQAQANLTPSDILYLFEDQIEFLA